MNVKYQPEMEKLFNRLNKTYRRNDQAEISEDDLNKMRSYVV